MLEQLEIKNYRSCQVAIFSPRKDLSILIGPNGSGKTNILNAILLLKKLCSTRESNVTEQPSNECQIKAKFNVDGKSVTLFARIGIDTDEGNRDIIISSQVSWLMPDFIGSRKRVKLPLTIGDVISGHGYFFYQHVSGTHYIREDSSKIKGALGPIRKISAYLREIKYYSASQFTNPSSCPVSFEVEKDGSRRRGVRLQGHSKFLYDLYEAYKNQSAGTYKEFINVIGPSGINLVEELKFREISTSAIGYSVRSGGNIKTQTVEKVLVIPQFEIGKNKLSPNQLSEGTFKTITLLFYVITETKSLLLIEEPEVCVHHGLLTSIVDLIKTYSKENQIIVSTHSDFVLDVVNPENVFKVIRNPKTGTCISAISKVMSKRELAALKTYLEEEGNLGEFWKHGGFD